MIFACLIEGCLLPYLYAFAVPGEHSKILTEIHEWTHKLSEAEENINSLKTYFEDDGYPREETNKKVLNG